MRRLPIQKRFQIDIWAQPMSCKLPGSGICWFPSRRRPHNYMNIHFSFHPRYKFSNRNVAIWCRESFLLFCWGKKKTLLISLSASQHLLPLFIAGDVCSLPQLSCLWQRVLVRCFDELFFLLSLFVVSCRLSCVGVYTARPEWERDANAESFVWKKWINFLSFLSLRVAKMFSTQSSLFSPFTSVSRSFW